MSAAEEISLEAVAWQDLAGALRHACALHHQGREDDALRAAQETLPGTIRRWSEASSESAAWKRRRLFGLIVEESRRVGEPVLLQQVMMSRLACSSQALAGARELLMGRGPLGGGISRRGDPAVTSPTPVPHIP